jgi:two-component system, NarL family, invasion response regulator UvrY
MISVLVASSSDIIRKGIKNLIGECPDMEVVGEAAHFHEMTSKIQNDCCDVLVLSLNLSQASALDVLKDIKRIRPKLHLIIVNINMNTEAHTTVRMIRAGADGYLSIGSSSERLIESIRKVSRGRKHFSTTFIETMSSESESDNEKSPAKILSDREYQVFIMIARGKGGNEIAKELKLSNKTVSTYRTRVLEKLEMTNSAEIIKCAMANNLIDKY